MTNEQPIDPQEMIELGLMGKRPLDQILDTTFRLQDLRELARSRGWKLQGTGKQAVVSQIASYHQADDGWAAQVRRLPEGLRVFLQHMWVAGAYEGGIQIGAVHSLARESGMADARLLEDLEKAQLSVESFILLGDSCLLWPDVYRVLPLDTTWLAPVAETRRLRRLHAGDPVRLALAARALPDYLSQHPLQAPSDLAGLWSPPGGVSPIVAERRGSDAIIKPQLPLLHLDTLKRLAAGLDLQPVQAHLLLLALAGLKYIARDDQGRIGAAPHGIEQIRHADILELARQIFRYLLSTSRWSVIDSLFPSPPIHVVQPVYSINPALQVEDSILWRQSLARALALLEPGAWYSLADLMRRLYQLRSAISSYARPYSGLQYMTADNRRMDINKEIGWQNILLRVYTYLITGPFHLMGLVDLASDDREVLAFRVTPYFRYFMGLAARPAPAAGLANAGRITFVSPTHFRIRSASDGPARGASDGPASPELHIFLSKLSAPAWEKGSPAPYRLSPERLQASLTGGASIEDLLSDLQQVCEGPLRNDTVALLREWAATYGHYHAHTDLTLIEFGDDMALPELLRSTDLAVFLRRQFSPRLIAIESRQADAFFRRLLRQGYTPTYSDSSDKPT